MNDKSLRPFGVKDQIGYVFGDMPASKPVRRCLFSLHSVPITFWEFRQDDGWPVFSCLSLG